MIKKRKKNEFSIGEIVVYPKHGVGEIKNLEILEISKIKTKYFLIQMEQDKLMIRVPINKVKSVGLRKIVSKKKIEEVLGILRQKPKVRRIMWSRRAQEYESKINSGDPSLLSEVIRDLHKKNNQTEQSYSERQMFQTALERLARELAAIEKTDYFHATEKIENILFSK